MPTSITVAQALSYEQDPSTIPAGAVFDIVDTAENIETLTASDISSLSSLLSVTSMTATDAPVTFTPGGPEQAALKSAGITITAEISASEAIALDVQHDTSGSPLLVPPDEHIIVLDTAANLESLTATQLSDLGSAVDTVNASGKNTGNSAVTQIAATDAPAVYATNQINALVNAGIVVVAPPNDPAQSDGTTIVTGRGTTFDIVWDSSVASAPAAFKTDVEEVFQLYADTYSSPVTLYYHVGYGEFDGSPLGSGFLGRSLYFGFPQETYSGLVSQLTADATSQAQKDALATLPASNPVGQIFVSEAQAEVLGFANAGTSSESNPDGFIGFSSDTSWNFSADPNQTPVANEWDFIGSVEHEVSEILGRGSYLGTEQYSLMDLYRYSGADTRALAVTDDPSYFSIDGGATNLGDWNNTTSGDTGDPGDWSGTTVNGVVQHTPDAFNDNSNANVVNPFTATDATLMNVLGYNFASAPVSPIPLASTDITLSAGQLLEYITLNEITPGSMNPPVGDSYVVIDTAFDIESITPKEITAALSIGVGEFIGDGAIAFLQSGQISALGSTPFLSVLTVAEAVAAEANPPVVPVAETVIVADTAANIEALNATDIAGFGATLGVTRFDVSDLSGTGPLTVQDGDTYAVHGAVTADETIDFTGAGDTLEFDDTPAMKGTVSGFATGDIIDLTDITNDPNGSVNLVANNVLDLSEHGSTFTLQLDKTQDFARDFFHLSADPSAGTDIIENTTPCYCRGTLIRTKCGQQRVEKLKIGDQVMTKSGVMRPIKWIGRRNFAGRFIMGRRDILPVCIKAGALAGNVPRRDLWVSPHHAMYFESMYFAGGYIQSAQFADAAQGLLIEAKDIVNGSSIAQAERVERLEYFHVELETHDVILAGGAWSETFLDDDSRAMFHNAHEFRLLYPEAADTVTQYCAPRLEDGYEVAAVRRRIALRAGLVPSADPCRASPLRGYVDDIGPRCIVGWARDTHAPEAPVCLDIYAGGKLLGRTLANLYREDLAQAGLGSGRHAFKFELPADFAIGAATVEVRRSLDGGSLAGIARARSVSSRQKMTHQRFGSMTAGQNL